MSDGNTTSAIDDKKTIKIQDNACIILLFLIFGSVSWAFLNKNWYANKNSNIAKTLLNIIVFPQSGG